MIKVAITGNICTGKTYNLEVIIKKIENMTGHFPSLEMESKFIRQKERKVLKGDPSKLYSFLKKHGKFVNFIPLEQTLSLMLSNDYYHLLSSGA